MQKPDTPDTERKATSIPDANGADVVNGDALVIRMPVDVRSVSLSIIAALAGILALQYAQSVLIPIVLGVLLSYAFSPMVDVARAPPRAARARRGARRHAARRQHWRRRLYAQRRSWSRSSPRCPKRRGACASASRPTSDQTRLGFPPAGAACRQGDRKDRGRRDQTRRGHTSLTDRTRPAPTAWRSSSPRSGPPTTSGSAASACSDSLASSLSFSSLSTFLLVTGDLYKRKLVKIAGTDARERSA